MRRLLIFLLLPAIITLWLVGWILYWVGFKKRSCKISMITVAGDACMERFRTLEAKQTEKPK